MEESFFASQCHFQRVVHGHHFAGGHDAGARMGEILQRIGQADQNQPRLGVGLQKLGAGRQGDLGAMVTTHAVNRYCDHWGIAHIILFKRPLAARK